MAALMHRRFQELRAPASAQSYFTQDSATGGVMGAEYLTPPFSKANWRDQELSQWEALMSSQDRKRQIRILKAIQWLHDDVARLVAKGPGNKHLPDFLAELQRDGYDATAASWRASQFAIKDAVDTLTSELVKEVGYVFLANDRGNKHGYGTIDRMRHFAKMEELVPKATLDLYNKAHTSMNSLKSVKRAGQKSKKQKKKGANSGGKPKLARCALCNGFGHVAGDANCKAVPRTQ